MFQDGLDESYEQLAFDLGPKELSRCRKTGFSDTTIGQKSEIVITKSFKATNVGTLPVRVDGISINDRAWYALYILP